MPINERELLKLVRANEVSCVITESFENSVELPKILAKKKDTRIWCTFPDNTTVVSLYTRLKKFRSISVDYVKKDDTYNDSNIVLSTTEYLNKRLMSYFEEGVFTKSKIDFCDIIVLGGVSLWTMQNTIFVNMWKDILEQKNDIEIPRLVLSMFNLDVDNTIPFDLSQSYFYIETEETQKVEYHDKNFNPSDRNLLNDMFEVIREKHEVDDKKMKYLVYCPSFNDVVILSSRIKKLKDVFMIFLTKDLDEKSAVLLNTRQKKDKRVIVVSTSTLIPVQNVSVVFDCMAEKLEYKTANESIKMKNGA